MALLDRWPHDVAAYDALVVLRMRGRVGDLGTAGDAALTLLRLSPGDAVNAGRMVRALSWRGHADEARAALAAIGATPDKPGFAKVFGELALYEGALGEARELFERERDASSAHWATVARILADDCVGASSDATQRVMAGESSGAHGIEWAYSLWYFATICADAPGSADKALERWVARQPRYSSYRRQGELAGMVLHGAAPPADALVARPEEPGHMSYRAEILRWIGDDPAVLRDAAKDARGRALAFPGGPSEGRMWQWLAETLEARAAWVEGDLDRAISLLEAVQVRPRDITIEADLGNQAVHAALLARAYEAAGRADDARAAWLAVARCHLGRLHRPYVQVLARRALGADVPASWRSAR
jgi:tetratricopeptide (TPR) repeat protein